MSLPGPYLYQRVALDQTTMAAATVYEDSFLGPITKTAARAWEQVGDRSKAPVLIGGRRSGPLAQAPDKSREPATVLPTSVGTGLVATPRKAPLREPRSGTAGPPQRGPKSRRQNVPPPPGPPDRADRLAMARR